MVNFQMNSLSGATSRSRPPSTPTAANSVMVISSPLSMAGMEISTPESEPGDVAAEHPDGEASFQAEVDG